MKKIGIKITRNYEHYRFWTTLELFLSMLNNFNLCVFVKFFNCIKKTLDNIKFICNNKIKINDEKKYKVKSFLKPIFSLEKLNLKN